MSGELMEDILGKVKLQFIDEANQYLTDRVPDCDQFRIHSGLLYFLNYKKRVVTQSLFIQSEIHAIQNDPKLS